MDHQTSFEPDQTRYEIEELLGEGLNSKVYRANRVDSAGLAHQRVALKFLKDQTDVSILRREFETLASVRSPYCARIIAWETRHDESVLALEWIDGVTLFDFAQAFATRLCADEINEIAREVVRQIYLGLRDLREAGLCHGDLQPKNIMIDRKGQIRLIDFANGRTEDGRLQATVAFVAPEVWSTGSLSYEADLFALGVIRKHFPSGFSDVCDSNARTSPSKTDSLLKLEPEQRSLRAVSENPAVRVRLGSYVERLLAKSEALSTQVFCVEPAVSTPVFVRSALVLALCLLVGVTAPVLADVDPVSPDSNTAKLTFASEHWMKIAVNGRDAGFTPLSLTHLYPGPHRIAWKTALAAGEIKIDLKANTSAAFNETRGGTLKVR